MDQLKSAALTRITQSQDYIRRGKYSEAIQAASDSINLCPLDIAILLRGQAYYRQASFKSAIQDLKKAYSYLFTKLSRGAPDSKGLFFKTNVMLAYSLLMDGNLAEAELFFLEAQEEQKAHPSLYQGEMHDLFQRIYQAQQNQQLGSFQQEEDKELIYEREKQTQREVKHEEPPQEETEIIEEDSASVAVPSTQKRKKVNEGDCRGDSELITKPVIGLIAQPKVGINQQKEGTIFD